MCELEQLLFKKITKIFAKFAVLPLRNCKYYPKIVECFATFLNSANNPTCAKIPYISFHILAPHTYMFHYPIYLKVPIMSHNLQHIFSIFFNRNNVYLECLLLWILRCWCREMVQCFSLGYSLCSESLAFGLSQISHTTAEREKAPCFLPPP